MLIDGNGSIKGKVDRHGILAAAQLDFCWQRLVQVSMSAGPVHGLSWCCGEGACAYRNSGVAKGKVAESAGGQRAQRQWPGAQQAQQVRQAAARRDALRGARSLLWAERQRLQRAYAGRPLLHVACRPTFLVHQTIFKFILAEAGVTVTSASQRDVHGMQWDETEARVGHLRRGGL